MSPENIRRAATTLAEAFVKGTAVEALPLEEGPLSLRDSYLIQDELTRRIGLDVVGWKIGLTSPELWKKYDVVEPIYGRALQGRLYASPASIKGLPQRLVLEAEFAFTMGRDLPAQSRPYTHDEVAAAVASVHPAFEIVKSRFSAWPGVPTTWIVADNGSNNGIVVGAACKDWRGLDLAEQAVTMFVNGEEIARGHGKSVMGNPFNAVVWLANERVRVGDGLRAGQVVTSGGCLGTHTVPSDALVMADFGDLGQVSVQHFE